MLKVPWWMMRMKKNESSILCVFFFFCHFSFWQIPIFIHSIRQQWVLVGAFFILLSLLNGNSLGNLFFFHIVEILFGELNFRLKSRRFKLVGPRQRKKYHPRTRANTILVLFRHRCVVLRSSLLASKHYVEKFFNFHFVVSSGKCVRLCGNCNFFC